jgi:uncharacterized protein
MSKKMIRMCALTLVLLALMCAPALAKVVSPGPDFYYLDNANVLSEDLKGEIFFANKLLYDACGAQIVVVTVDSTGRDAIDDYAYELFNSWGIGDAAKNNGFLLLLAINDDDYYARTGSGLDRRFSASTIKEYYDDYLERDFAAKRYEAGVRKFFEAVFDRIATTYNADVTTADGIAAYNQYMAQNAASDGFGGYTGTRRSSAVNSDYRGYHEDDDSGMGFGLVLAVILVIILVVLVSKGRRARRRVVVMPPPPPPPMGIGYRPTRTVWHTGPTIRSAPPRSRPSSGGLFGGGGSSFGGGGAFRSSSGGGFRSSSGRSSGFGGASGGGGRSSGGGAGRGRH